MRFHIVTIFPEFFKGPFDFGVTAKARAAGLLEIHVHDLRNWTYDRHRTVDDRPFGGGEGMLLKPQPVFEAVESILPVRAERKGRGCAPPDAKGNAIDAEAARVNPRPSCACVPEERDRIVLLSAQGKRFDQSMARRFAEFEDLLLICGRYEGVDERISQYLADEEISVGDFVLSGGELAAAMIVDAVSRLLPGVLGNEASSRNESFSGSEGLLDCPQYTRPAEFRGWRVPDVLLGGNHAEILRWRRAASREKTERQRPDLIGAPDEI